MSASREPRRKRDDLTLANSAGANRSARLDTGYAHASGSWRKEGEEWRAAGLCVRVRAWFRVDSARMPDLVKSCSRMRQNGKEGASHHPSPRVCAATPASARRHSQDIALDDDPVAGRKRAVLDGLSPSGNHHA